MNKVFIALGSNIRPRDQYLERAIERLGNEDSVTIIRQSSIYKTKPVGYVEQEDFLNQIIEIETTYSALELLRVCQRIENDLERKREVRWGPRTIDLDILLYNQENIMMDQLYIPHPRMHERAFVLVPLVELDPNLIIPTIDKSVSEQLLLLPNEEKRGVEKWIKKDGGRG